jgi:hypothetical protein
MKVTSSYFTENITHLHYKDELVNVVYEGNSCVLECDQVKKNEMGRTCGTYGERRGTYRALVGNPEKRRQLGRPRRMWEDNIKIDLREVGWGVHGLDLSGPG